MRKTQNLITDEFAELLIEEGAMHPLKKNGKWLIGRNFERMIIYGQQLSNWSVDGFGDSDIRIDEFPVKLRTHKYNVRTKDNGGCLDGSCSTEMLQGGDNPPVLTPSGDLDGSQKEKGTE